MDRNSPEHNSNLEIQQRKVELKTLYARGINTPDNIGYHGTSLEAIKEILRTGSLPGNTTGDGMLIGDIFFILESQPSVLTILILRTTLTCVSRRD